MERHLLSALLLVLFLSVTAVCGDEYTENVSCSNNQTAFNGSCYEFVNLTLSFVKAQARCERGGGHLVFIRSEETQQFLQKHLNSTEHNWWIGLVSTSYNSSSNVSTGKMVIIMLDRRNPKLLPYKRLLSYSAM